MIQNNFQHDLEGLLLQNNCSKYVNNNNLDYIALENNYINVLKTVAKHSKVLDKIKFPERLYNNICLYLNNSRQIMIGIPNLDIFITEGVFTKCDYIAYAYYYFRRYVKNNL